jgi:hypothetical protein
MTKEQPSLETLWLKNTTTMDKVQIIDRSNRLRMSENRVLRRILRPKGGEMTGEWRKLHNEELRNFYSSLYIIRLINSRSMRRAGHVARMGKIRNTYKIFVGLPEETTLKKEA